MVIIWKRFLAYVILAIVVAVLDAIAQDILHIEVKLDRRVNSIVYRAVRDVLSWTTLIGMLWVWGFL